MLGIGGHGHPPLDPVPARVEVEVPPPAVLRSEGMRVIGTPVHAPNANAHAERVNRDDAGRVPRLDAHPRSGPS